MKKKTRNRLKIIFLGIPYLIMNFLWEGLVGAWEFVKDCWELWFRDYE